jgi:aspartate aminotransferase
MEYLSKLLQNMEESATIAMAAKARELKANGVDVISLSLGEPDFKTPNHIREAAKQAIDDGSYFSYPPVPGYPDLREAIAEKFRRDNGLNSKASNIVVSTGAKQSIANVMMSLLNDGDEAIVLSPYWVSYSEVIRVAGGVPVFVEGTLENDFKATAAQIKEAITDKTKILIFSSPCNPTGSVFTSDELKAIAQVLAPHEGIFVIADEIYEHINFTDSHASIGAFPEIQDRTITINGVSKGYAMTGWRIGYISAPEFIAKACTKIQGQFTSGASSIAQRAALAALTGDSGPTKEMADEYFARREMVHELLSQIPGIKTNMPKGAFYFFPEVSEYFGKSYNGLTINSASDMSMYLLNEAHVSVVTGEAFGAPKCIRISYAASREELVDAMARIKEALSKLS